MNKQDEPVAWMDKTGITHKHKHFEDMQPLYTHPQPKREWIGLTEEEVIDCWPGLLMHMNCAEFWKNIEAKLKEKNT